VTDAPIHVVLMVASAIAVVLLGIGARRASIEPRRLAASMGVAMGAVVISAAAALVLAPGQAVNGLIPAWPIVLMAPMGMTVPRPVRRSGSSVADSAQVRFQLTIVVLVVTGLIALTAYPSGGGLQWGGRYYAGTLVPLAALIAVVLRRLATTWERSPRCRLTGAAAAIAAMTVLGVLPTMRGVGVVRAHRESVAEIRDAVRAPGHDLIITDSAWLASLDWSRVPSQYRFFVVGAAELERAVGMAAAAGRAVTVAWPATSEAAGTLPSSRRVASPVLERSGYQLWEVRP
jgi:hypothetical protein